LFLLASNDGNLYTAGFDSPLGNRNFFGRGEEFFLVPRGSSVRVPLTSAPRYPEGQVLLSKFFCGLRLFGG
jgi:hypothetical protein